MNGLLCHFLFEFLAPLRCRLSTDTHSSVHARRNGKLGVCTENVAESKILSLLKNLSTAKGLLLSLIEPGDCRKVGNPTVAYAIAGPSDESSNTGLALRSLTLLLKCVFLLVYCPINLPYLFICVWKGQGAQDLFVTKI